MRISVAMCTYNGQRYLQQQLESLSSQNHLPEQLVVCDDGSTDDTVHIISDFAAKAPFPVQLYVNKQNLGSTKNFEQAIAHCDGDIIALCDQDDVWLPRKLECMANEFARSPTVGLVFTDAEVVDEQLQPLGYSLWKKLQFDREEQDCLRRGRGFDSLLQAATVTGATAAFRERFKPLLLPIPDNLPLIHDGWIAVLLAAVADVTPIAESLVKYRQHGHQQVGALARKTASSSGVQFREALRRTNPYEEMLQITKSVYERLVARQEQFDSRKVLPGLEARMAHLEARSRLPKTRLRRGLPVLRELLSGRYHRYSSGAKSAAKDLFA